MLKYLKIQIIIHLLTFFFIVTKSWIVLYEASLTSQSQCSNKLLDQFWKTSSGSLIQQCDNSCIQSLLSSLSFILDSTNSHIKIAIPISASVSNIYTQYGVEATIHIDNQPSIQIQINNNTPQTISTFYQTIYSDHFSYLCGLKSFNFYKVTSSITLTNMPSQLEIKFIKGITNKGLGIRYIRVWASCAKNCQTCSGLDDCQTCFTGLQRFIFPETGKGSCETTQNCNIANCFSCAISSTRIVCLKCLAGYTLNSSYQCQANAGASCSTGKYRNSSGNCVSYASSCYYEDKQTGILTNCNGVEDVSAYKCQSSDFIYVLDKYNYGEVRCGCFDLNCSTCSNYQNCTSCLSGYLYNSSNNKCEKICSQEGTYYNSTLSSCQNCSDTNCSSCTSNQCLACKMGYILNLITKVCISSCSNGQFFNSSQQQCQNCSSGCQQCQSTNTCSQCQSNLVWNSSLNKCVMTCTSPQVFDVSTEQCITCGSNCFMCTSTICQTCLDISYQIDQSDQKKCKRIPLICSSNQYYDEISYTCVNCSIYCLTCNSNTCLTCINNTYQVDNNNLQNCKRIPLSCLSNQYEDYINYMCVNCSQNCSTCNSNTCLTCLDNTYQIDQNNIKQCKRIPLNCASNQYYDEPSYNCINCSQNCSNCNSSTCLTCIDNTYEIDSVDQKQCKRIPLNCTLGKYYDEINYICAQCNQNCLNCDKSKCLQCDNFYQIDPNNIQNCQVIPLNCKSNEYYDQINNTCEQCQNNCTVCTQNECLQCTDQTYIINPQVQTQCILRTCSQYCSVCDIQSCKKCINNNYIVNQNSPLNCTQKCEISNCITCSQTNYNECSKCQDGYYLNLLDYSCKFICEVNNCSQCEPGIKNQCKVCNQYFQLNQQTKQCTEVCQMKNCKQCQSNQPLQCKLCQEGYNLDQKDSFCYKSDKKKNKFYVKQSLDQNIYMFQIIFDEQLNQDLKNYEGNKNIIELTIENRSDFDIKYFQKSQYEINIQLTMQNEIKNKRVKILFNSNQFIMENDLESNKDNVDLLPYVKVSSSNQQAGEKIGDVASGVSQSLASSFLPIIIFSNFYVLVNTIDLTAFYYYLLFIDVRMPQNVINFFAIFQDFQFPFIPNMFQNIIDDSYIQYSPKKFVENGCQGYFITNGGQSMTICSGIVALYLLARLGQQIPIRFISQYCSKAIQRTWHYSGFFDMCYTVYIYLIFAVFLQFYVFEFDDTLSPLNYILFFATAFITIPFPFFIFKILHQTKNIKSNNEFQLKYQTLISGLKLYDQKVSEVMDASIVLKKDQIGEENNKKSNLENYDFFSSPTNLQSAQIIMPLYPTTREILQIKLSKYYFGICYLRKLVYAILITYLHNHQYYQLSLISLLNIFFIIYLIYLLPFQKNHENIKHAAGEISLIIIQICICLLVKDSDDQNEDERYNIGWVIISVSGLIIIWNTLQIIYELRGGNRSKVQTSDKIMIQSSLKESDSISNKNKVQFLDQMKSIKAKQITKKNNHHYDFQFHLPQLILNKKKNILIQDQSKDLTKDDNYSYQGSPSFIPNSPYSSIIPLNMISQELKMLNPSPFSSFNNQNDFVNQSQKLDPESMQLEEHISDSTRRKRISLSGRSKQVSQQTPIKLNTPRKRINSQQVEKEENSFR